MRRLPYLAIALLLTIAVAAAWWLWLRPQRDAQLLREYTAADIAAEGGLQARWFGTTAVLLRDEHHALLIDPFFTRPPGLWPLLRNARIAPDEALIAEQLRKAGIDRLDAVLVSHSHYDHAMDAGVVARMAGAVLIGSDSTANIGRGAGLDESRLRVAAPGQVFEIGDFRVRFIESRHAGATGGRPTGNIGAPLRPPAHYLDYRQGGTYSIVVEHPQTTVLHHGSAGYLTGSLRGVHADTVFLGAALVGDPQSYVEQVVDAVGADRIVLVHWDDFTRPLSAPLRPMPLVVDLEPLLRFIERERPRLQVLVPDLSRPLPLSSTAAP